jgi:hypothetical protein
MDTDEPIEEPKPMVIDSTPPLPKKPHFPFMEVILASPDTPSTSSTSTAEKVVGDSTEKKPEVDNQPLPNVVIGSEAWHTHFPNEWIPIITRDVVRQSTQVRTNE